MPSVIIEPSAVFSPGELRRLRRWIRVYESPLRALLEQRAKAVFSQFDIEFFKRTGGSESAYREQLIEEFKKEALLLFTEMPNGSNRTAFHSHASGQTSAYKQFEREYLAERSQAAARQPFKAYVARRLGLR